MKSRVWAALIATALVASMAGCAQPDAEEPTLTPTVSPPVIASEGVLKVGSDLSYPPFAGTDKGVKAGIDVDVAAAIAERLGLRLELVDTKPADMTASLDGGEIDIMLGAVPITDAVLANVTVAGSYLVDGPAIFALASDEATDVPGSVVPFETLRVGAQNASASYWELKYEFGDEFPRPFDTLTGAFDALKAGDLDRVVADAAVGAYIARDYERIVFADQYGTAEPLGVCVRKDATELETAVRGALDEMAADGTLETIRRKWVGDTPVLTVTVDDSEN